MDLLAYLDPGSGSMILQIIAGGAAAVAVTAKLYWNRILTFLRIRKPEDESAAPQSTDSSAHSTSLGCTAARHAGGVLHVYARNLHHPRARARVLPRP